jgi:ADP-ribose pyrophosphatase
MNVVISLSQEEFMSGITVQYGKEDYQLIKREPCYEGFFRLEEVSLKHRLFNGSWSREISREIFIRGNATCVLPYDPVEDKVVLLEQFRPGAILEEQSPWLLELVAGMNGVNEIPEDVARREAVEEADLELKELEKICEYLVSPGGTTEKVYLYCARVSVQGGGGVFGLDDEDEDIKVHTLDFSEAYGLLESGVINNAAAIMALQWLALNRERLQEQW